MNAEVESRRKDEGPHDLGPPPPPPAGSGSSESRIEQPLGATPYEAQELGTIKKKMQSQVGEAATGRCCSFSSVVHVIVFFQCYLRALWVVHVCLGCFASLLDAFLLSTHSPPCMARLTICLFGKEPTCLVLAFYRWVFSSLM